jgi:hypothetical protein
MPDVPADELSPRLAKLAALKVYSLMGFDKRRLTFHGDPLLAGVLVFGG